MNIYLVITNIKRIAILFFFLCYDQNGQMPRVKGGGSSRGLSSQEEVHMFTGGAAWGLKDQGQVVAGTTG